LESERPGSKVREAKAKRIKRRESVGTFGLCGMQEREREREAVMLEPYSFVGRDEYLRLELTREEGRLERRKLRYLE